MPARIAINGFGRIGRAAFKILQDRSDAEVVAINDLGSIENLVYLLKYDTVYGKYDKDVSFDEKHIIVEGKKVPILSEKEPMKLPWKDLEVDVVLECTGIFVKDNASKAHVDAGAKKVIVSAPTKGEDDDIQTFLKGVNHENYLGQNAISNASCTTNCIAPVVAVIHSEFKILKSVMTTIHGYTSIQNLVDGPHKDLRRGRAAAMNLIPTTTGAAAATTKAIPELQDLFDGIAVRVPVLVGSLSDLTFLVEKQTTVEEVNKAFVEAKDNPLYKGVLDVTEEPLVSSDIVGNPFSAVIDLNFTRVIGGDLVKVFAWYDNEWGYANRLVEMALLISQ
jgi:glyceraldehyde 3-phosphate dehydrogenase